MKVLLVDDSALVRSILKQVLTQEGFEIAGEATNGRKAVELAGQLSIDIIIMDINMPIMDGLEATKHIMKENPVPILIFSTEVNAQTSFEAVNNGALDIMKKPELSNLNDEAFVRQFSAKLINLSRSPIFKHRDAHKRAEHVSGRNRTVKMVVLGASTGGPIAVREVLRAIPSGFPAGIAVVQHLEEGFDAGYAQWLNECTELNVRLAGKQEVPKGGEVLIAPVNKHIRFDGKYLIHDDGPRVLNQKPSVDVLFQSAAEVFRENLLGVLLTGMGRDGGEGCAGILRAGGYTLIQDEATSVIFGMPKAAIEMQGASEVLSLSEIPKRMIQITGLPG